MDSRDSPWRGRVAVLGVLATLALPERWLAIGRDALVGDSDAVRFLVTTTLDNGPGSLREAIFAADRAERQATIVLRTPRVVLTSALPPLVNPRGVHIDASDSGTELDATAFPDHSVLEIRAPGSVVRGLRIRGASNAALLVRAPGVRLDGLTIRESTDGVTLAAGASDVVIEHSRFEDNDTGIRIGDVVSRVTIRHNTFARHGQAGVRAVLPRVHPAAGAADFQLLSNRFEDDRISLVMINVGGRVEENTIVGARESAVYLMGPGAIVRRNRTRGGAGLGIMADGTDGALIEGNELDHNAAVGLLVRAGQGTVAQNNRVYSNGYGIAVVFGGLTRPHVVRDNLLVGHTHDALYVVGSSPLVSRNRALSNGVAALRVLAYVPLRGPRIAARPHLDANVFERNTLDRPVQDEYRVRRSEVDTTP